MISVFTVEDVRENMNCSPSNSAISPEGVIFKMFMSPATNNMLEPLSDTEYFPIIRYELLFFVDVHKNELSG